MTAGDRARYGWRSETGAYIVAAHMLAILDDLAGSPPPRFAGGVRREAMRGAMAGVFEIRVTGPGREQSRLFCMLENGTSEELQHRTSRPDPRLLGAASLRSSSPHVGSRP